MSVSDTYEPVLTTGDGSEDEFDFDFLIFNDTDLEVALVDPDTLAATDQTLGVDYSVTIDTTTPGGTVTFDTPPEDGTLVSIRRNVPITQTTDIPAGGLFREVQIENALDKNVLIMQQLQEQIDRAILQSPYSSITGVVLPAPLADAFIGWNSAGDELENKTLVDLSAVEKASTADAQAGTNDDKYMTPLKTKEAIEANASMATRGTFINSGLTAGKLTVTHNKALTAPYSAIVKVFDNSGKEVLPDEITGATNSFEINLTSFGTLSGTWGYAYIA